jgi:glycoprotein 3-alpha-L-fucosyltransferase
VLWVASNCFIQNNRQQIVTNLQEHIKVDIYGECGKGRISREQMQNYMQSTYKFYLAFENSNCQDYITEKFYNSLAYAIFI